MTGKHSCLGLLVWALLLIQSSQAFFSLPSPWGYRCASQNGTCIKEEKTGISGFTTLAHCKLTCGPHGVIWPKPKTSELGNEVVQFLPSNIDYRISAHPEVSALLREALAVFKNNLDQYNPKYSDGTELWNDQYDSKTVAHKVFIDITVSGMDTHLTLDTDESYTLAVLTKEDKTTATIIASNFFGARHALETLSQLIDYDENTKTLILVSTAMISDSPAFSYRGILLDTSRNFISVKAIERTLDAMAANKLNTFHWHITDSHSFPLYMPSLPKMAYYGAYSASQIYYPADVKHVVKYGRVRGIRVLPEFDAPAHVGNGFQWGPQHGLGNLVVCENREPWQSFCVEPPCGQLNIANPNMYDVLGQIYKEMVDLFGPIDLFHYGGDEVNLNCWNTTDEVTDWMTENGFGLDEKAYYNQWSVFQEKSQDLLTKANNGKKVPGIIWTSHLTEAGRADVYLNPHDYIIQIWTTGVDPLIGELLDKNFRVIFSNYDHWYLDCGFGAWVGEGNNWCSPYKGWQAVYDNSPIKIAKNLTTSFDRKLVLGGEAALWTEQADDAVLDSRLWPRGSALAERLWSDPDHNWQPAETRLIHQRQRLVQRGIQADRIQPQWCHQNEGLCYL
ncbi:chitooligosaccharidolytic beta-N-acetylglucosaminidase-like [Macrobrachium nipponense]|uniref:chitooligosaccharidolytic beta-N-acetylglucosaminidase-like n=1 Tax=Macrobrachium nipponense TaxID=159736 RepID=UPI0030C855F8